ncbi:MAG: hypothetical protein H0T62_11535 [Parachlamydiaceae bacterium]|nr:hypothetical protein [Parachlamydiaceae bacterium]
MANFNATPNLGANPVDWNSSWKSWGGAITGEVHQQHIKINQINTAGKALETLVNTHINLIDTNTNSIQALTYTSDQHGIEIGSIKASAILLSNIVSGHTTQIGALQVKVVDITNTVNDHSTSINNLQGDVITTAQTANTNTTNIQRLTATSTTHTDEIAQLTVTSTTHTDEIAALNQSSTAHNNGIINLNANVNEHTVGINALNTSVQNLDDRMIIVEKQANTIFDELKAFNEQTAKDMQTLDEQTKDVGLLSYKNQESLNEVTSNLKFLSAGYEKLTEEQEKTKSNLDVLGQTVINQNIATVELKKTVEKKFAEQDVKFNNIEVNIGTQNTAINDCYKVLKVHDKEIGDSRKLIEEHSSDIKKNNSHIIDHSVKIERQETLLSCSKELNNKHFGDLADCKDSIKNHTSSISKLETKQSGFKSDVLTIKEKLNYQGDKLDKLDNFHQKIKDDLLLLEIALHNTVNNAERNLNEIVKGASQENHDTIETVNKAKDEVKNIENRLSTLMDLVGQIEELKAEIKVLREDHGSQIESLKSSENNALINLSKQVSEQSLIIHELKSEIKELKLQQVEINELKLQQVKYENFMKIATKAFIQLERGEVPLHNVANELGISTLNVDVNKLESPRENTPMTKSSKGVDNFSLSFASLSPSQSLNHSGNKIHPEISNDASSKNDSIFTQSEMINQSEILELMEEKYLSNNVDLSFLDKSTIFSQNQIILEKNETSLSNSSYFESEEK